MSITLLNPLNNLAKTQRVIKHLSVLVNVLLVLAIAWLLSEISWLFYPQDKPASIINPPGKPVENLKAQQNFRHLTAAHIFGFNATSLLPKQTNTPETKLNLTLKGVFAAEPMKLATAIIAQGRTGKEQVYSVGDKMKDGVIIKEIQAHYVVLDRHGRLEILKFSKQRGLNNTGFNRPTTDLNALGSRTPGQVLTQIRNNILRSPTSFGDYALPVVVRENGRQIGYRLLPQAKGQLLAELGLQPSDIITRINGVNLNRPQNGITALRKLSTANQLSLIVKRNGNEVPLNIRLR